MPLVTPPSATALKTGITGLQGHGETEGSPLSVTEGDRRLPTGVVGDGFVEIDGIHGHMSSIDAT